MSALRQIKLICMAASPAPGSGSPELCEELTQAAGRWPELISVASKYLITPSLAHGLAKKGLTHLIPPDAAEYLDSVLLLNRQRNSDIRAQALELAGALGNAGLYPLFLKGTANLLAGLYEDGGQRIIGDIDLLVPPGQMEDTLSAVINAGYAVDETSLHPPYLFHVRVMYRHDRIAVVEPHFRLHHLRGTDILDPKSVSERGEFLEADGVRIRIPSPFDRVCHNVIHGMSKHGPFDNVFFYQLYDYSLLLSRYGNEEFIKELRKQFSASGSRHLDIYDYFSRRLFGVNAAGSAAKTGIRPMIYWGLFKGHLRSRTLKLILFLAETASMEYAKFTESPQSALTMLKKTLSLRPYRKFMDMLAGKMR